MFVGDLVCIHEHSAPGDVQEHQHGACLDISPTLSKGTVDVSQSPIGSVNKLGVVVTQTWKGTLEEDNQTFTGIQDKDRVGW